MSNVSKRCKEPGRGKYKSMGDHEKFMQRITKTLYYGKLPVTERLSLPVTELAAELFSEAQYGRSLERLHSDVAATISRNACVSPCSLVLALLYLDRLKTYNPEYLQRVAPSELFLVSLMVSSKFLNDDGEDDEVFISEWASSAGITAKELGKMEKDFLNAIEWEVFVSEKSFWSRLRSLERVIALRQGNTRGGWYTYTDLQHLLEDIELFNLVHSVFTVTTVLLASYTASMLTLVGSVLLSSHVPGTALYRASSLPTSALSVPVDDNLGQLTTEISDQALHYDAILDILDTFNEEPNDTTIDLVAPMQKHSGVIDPVNVLTTSFILASIQTGGSAEDVSKRCTGQCSNETNDIQRPETWDWWSNDLLTWIYNQSVPIKTETKYIDTSKNFEYGKRLDMSIANCKLLSLEDHIHKATSIRLQDQLESSWHEEWSDTILKKYLLPNSRYMPYLVSLF